ncbi:MAG: hypothetical protein R3F65_03550 [bacterium]
MPRRLDGLAPAAAPHALAAFLAERYETLAALAAAWESEYPGDDFAFVVEAGPRPVPYVQSCNLACREDLQRFVHERLLPAWVALITGEIRRADPTHLVATPRLALASTAAWRFWSAHDDVWADAPAIELPSDRETVRYRPWHLLGRRGDVGFDLIAVNVYTGADRFPEPWLTDGITAMHRESGLPVLVSELGVRARIEGWSNRGGAFAFVPGGRRRRRPASAGRSLSGQVAQLVALPMVVGAPRGVKRGPTATGPTTSRRQINLRLVQCRRSTRPRRRPALAAARRGDPRDELRPERPAPRQSPAAARERAGVSIRRASGSDGRRRATSAVRRTRSMQ